MVPCSGIMCGVPPAHLPWTVINLDGFCNWLEFNGMLGFWNEDSNTLFYYSRISAS